MPRGAKLALALSGVMRLAQSVRRGMFVGQRNMTTTKTKTTTKRRPTDTSGVDPRSAAARHFDALISRVAEHNMGMPAFAGEALELYKAVRPAADFADSSGTLASAACFHPESGSHITSVAELEELANDLDMIRADHDTLHRAIAALYRTDAAPQQPSEALSFVETYGDKDHAVLRSKGGDVIACYRVRNDGKLKRLKRLPAGLWRPTPDDIRAAGRGERLPALSPVVRQTPEIAADANGKFDSDQMLRYAVTGAIKQAARAAEPAARRSIGNDKLPDMTGTLALFRKKR